jgi:hypothetical protein
VDEAGFSPGQRPVHFIVSLTLMVLIVAAVALVIVGIVVGGSLVWIGLALSVATVVLMIATSLHRRGLVDKVRRQEGTVTFRTVEPGDVGEAGQYVACDIELNPPANFTRVATIVGPMDAKLLVVGSTMRCLVDRIDGLHVLRVFPYAGADAPLPNGRMLKFHKP